MFASDKYDFITFGGCHNGAINKGDYEKFKEPDESGHAGSTMQLAKSLVTHRDQFSNKKVEPIRFEQFLVTEFLSRNGNTYLIATYDSFELFSDERVEQIITVWQPRPYA